MRKKWRAKHAFKEEEVVEKQIDTAWIQHAGFNTRTKHSLYNVEIKAVVKTERTFKLNVFARDDAHAKQMACDKIKKRGNIGKTEVVCVERKSA